MDNEIWKTYKETGSNGWGHRVYEVSNLGRVKLNGKIINPPLWGNYYRLADKLLHRIVAELFVPNPENKPCVDHINTDCLDNIACNLRWVTQKENCNNLLTKKKHSKPHKPHKPTGRRTKGFTGRRHSEETKAKMREAWVKRKERDRKAPLN